MVQKKDQKSDNEQLEIVKTKLELQAEKAAKHREYHKANNTPKTHHSYITTKIKNQRYKETLAQTQSELSKPDKYISRFIHMSFIYDVSELISKTIFRPIALLINGLVTLIIGLAVIFWGRRIGLDYPNTIFIVIFIVVYPISLILDIVISIINKRK